jgi:hypothetical protein
VVEEELGEEAEELAVVLMSFAVYLPHAQLSFPIDFVSWRY